MGVQIWTGVVDGTTVPTAQRWQMLYNMWVPYQLGGFVTVIWIAVAQLLMGSLVGCSPSEELGRQRALS